MGPAGVGKTRMALESLRIAAEYGYPTAQVMATRSATTIPFGAFARFLPHMEKIEMPGAVDNRSEMLRHLASAFIERSGGRRLMMVVDDAQYLDDGSATLIHQLVVSDDTFVVATVLANVPAPEPITALWKDRLAERIELNGLPTEAIGELLSSVLGGTVDPSAVARLAVHSQGNALYLRELVQGALESGALHNQDAIWRMDSLAPSLRLAELVETRLADLQVPERQFLELAAYGEPLGTAELNAFGGGDRAELLERKGLIRSERSGRRLEIRLAHPVYGDVLRAHIPYIKEQNLARQLTQTVQAAGSRRRDDKLRMATWALISGDLQADLILDAATTARWRYDFSLSERLARAALQAGAGFPAAFLLAQLAGLQGHPEEAEEELQQLASVATGDAQIASVAIERLDNLIVQMGRFDEAALIAEEALRTVRDADWRDQIESRRVLLAVTQKGPRAALEIALPLLEHGSATAQPVAAYAAAYALAHLGRTQAALDTADQGLAIQRTLATPLAWYPWLHDTNKCLALLFAGRLAEATEMITSQYDVALDTQATEAIATYTCLRALLACQEGRVTTAERLAREAAGLSMQLDDRLEGRLAMICQALASAYSGRAPNARAVLQRIDKLGLPPPADAVLLWRAEAWTKVASGAIASACEQLLAAAKTGEQTGDLAGAASALHDLTRLGQAKRSREQLQGLASKIEGPLSASQLAHTCALADDDADELDGAAQAFEATGTYLLAAEAAADAAVVWHRKGDTRKALSSEQHAARLATRCEEASTPALQSVDIRVQLTPAERETALLAASGRSNKQIAEQLFLSVRTVENRLQHIYDKLGIRSRTELSQALKGT